MRRRGNPTPQRLSRVVLRVEWVDRANRRYNTEVSFWGETAEADMERFIKAVRSGEFTIDRHYVVSEGPA